MPKLVLSIFLLSLCLSISRADETEKKIASHIEKLYSQDAEIVDKACNDLIAFHKKATVQLENYISKNETVNVLIKYILDRSNFYYKYVNPLLESSVRTGRNGKHISIIVRNRSKEEVTLYWLNNGKRVKYPTIKPGHEVTQSSFGYSYWIIVDTKGKVVYMFYCINQDGRVLLR
jgi:hypothetical protein